ncbi:MULTISPECIES: hypothetical protein [unclassified Pseudoalteromonas]|uniref:hypothetical protein n=1 Tax=unclassified Pseudoalteromonas TaxID=194690 RepID=UPI0025B59224|nr:MULTISPECIES: hypothetical protein [unclassified Pseudoalteromonas]MDN3380174.1 hypothetical protein [Pseudoalteromonas sp. APC 3893]MDN3388439.1 hypothetical protein [Pseudoalteromonas sp. APC 4017]
MIKDIPTSSEFNSAAKAQFDFAWDIVISFLLTLDDAGRYSDIDERNEIAFWETARQRILTALIIVQQGVELSLKGKLVSISPYLLIAGNPSDWPKDPDGSGVSFSDFRALDAQDLIKVHNTASTSQLDGDFVNLFEKVRKLRNKAMHTVDRELNVSAQDVVTILLEVHEHLYPSDNWVSTRRDFLFESPATHVHFDTDHVNGLIAKEFLTVFNFLTRSQIKRFFKIDKRQRLYLCPECHYESEKYEMIEPKYAVLQPNEPDSEHLYCFVCDDLHPVTRTDCTADDCPGNVISYETGCCCTCSSEQG